MEAVLRECEELEVEIATNNKLQAAAREEAAALKKKGNELKDHVVTAVWALQEAEAEEEKLRLQVVTSPDRRKSEKLVREERLRKAKVECAELDELAQAHKTKLVNGKQAVNELETHTNVALVELLDISNKHTEFVRKMEDTRRKLASHKKNRAEIDEQMEESDIELTRLEKAIVQQRKQHTLQMDAAQESLEQSQSRLLHVERERRNGMARVDAGAANVQALQAQIDLERREAEAKVQALISHYQTVEQAFLNRNQLYMDALPSHSEN